MWLGMECELELEFELESDMELGSELDSGSFPSCNLSGHVPDAQRRTTAARGDPSGHSSGHFSGAKWSFFRKVNGHFSGAKWSFFRS